MVAHHSEKGDLIEMTNGCICCTLREDLLQRIKDLVNEDRFDCIVVESTGIGEPLSIAETFTFEIDETKPEGAKLNDVARLDTMVTVVDSSSLLHDMALVQPEIGDEKQQLSALLTDQIEFANVVVLNKIDLVSREALSKVSAIVRCLNPTAKIVESDHGRVDFQQVIDTKLFSFEQAQSAAGWLQALRGQKVPETLEYGIGSIVWRSEKPIHPILLQNVLMQSPFSDKIIRSKGIVWLSNAIGKERSVEWSGAGHSYVFYYGQKWFYRNHGENSELDCRNEVVLIGFFQDPSISKTAVEKLEACLLPTWTDIVGGVKVEAIAEEFDA
jgi:G3E family GTPase